ncbi:MAG: hypothetical protein LUQ51_00600, partial [Methanothrix sp.]|nr:hypothetical protein [Methanothrix sp.]
INNYIATDIDPGSPKRACKKPHRYSAKEKHFATQAKGSRVFWLQSGAKPQPMAGTGGQTGDAGRTGR